MASNGKIGVELLDSSYKRRQQRPSPVYLDTSISSKTHRVARVTEWRELPSGASMLQIEFFYKLVSFKGKSVLNPNFNFLFSWRRNQKNPWRATSATGSYQPDYQGSGYSGNSDTLSSGSRKYAGNNHHTTVTLQKYGTGGQSQVTI